jgi:hypothetical protein
MTQRKSRFSPFPGKPVVSQRISDYSMLECSNNIGVMKNGLRVTGYRKKAGVMEYWSDVSLQACKLAG